MENEFVPYELAVKLKELGFECNYSFREYDTEGYLQHTGLLNTHGLPHIDAPLWQQAFSFVMEIVTELPGRYTTRIIYHTDNIIHVKDNPWYSGIDFNSRKECLEYLISLICK